MITLNAFERRFNQRLTKKIENCSKQRFMNAVEMQKTLSRIAKLEGLKSETVGREY
jgi:hypothetical protein